MSKILIVDDDPDFRESCRLILEAAGFEVAEAGDPEQGVEKVETDKPDLLILDVLMPREYEGFDVVRRLRADSKLRDLPILMLSAVHDAKDTPYRFRPDPTYLPIEAFLDKPVAPKVLVRKVREMLSLQRDEPQEPL